MRKRVFLCVVISALLINLPTKFHYPMQVLANTPLALLVSCMGDVTVLKSDGGTVQGVFGLPLGAGDEVRTGDASRTEILFENSTLVKVGANSSTLIAGAQRGGATASATPVGEKSFETVQNFLKLKDSGGTKSLAQLRAGDTDQEVRAESPCQTGIQEAHPTFRWHASDPSVELRVTVYTDEGVRWEHDVTGGTEVSYPADAPALHPGTTYWWTLKSTDPLRFPPIATSAVPFWVLDPADAKTLETALSGIEQDKSRPSSYHFLRASLYFDYGLKEAAIEETLQALEGDTENPILHSILARLYAETGRRHEALGEYDRLLDAR